MIAEMQKAQVPKESVIGNRVFSSSKMFSPVEYDTTLPENNPPR